MYFPLFRCLACWHVSENNKKGCDLYLMCLSFVVQYFFLGSWLSDLTRARYEVREKKCIKKVYSLQAGFLVNCCDIAMFCHDLVIFANVSL